MSEPTTDELAWWAALAEAATPGPWSAADEHGLMKGATPAWCVSRMDGERYLYDVAYLPQHAEREQVDAEFIAAARTAVPRLLALVAAQAEQIAELRAGEADADPKEGIIPTSAQWLRKYNRATPEKRLDVAAMVIEDGRTAMRCWEEDHPRVIAIWRDRAERAEAHLARVRALCDRIESEAGRRMFTDGVLSLAGAFRAALEGTEGDA